MKERKEMLNNSFSGTIIITDPCYFAKDEDWGEDSNFDYVTSEISSPEFTKYVWVNTGIGDGTWKVIQMKDILCQRDLEDHILKVQECFDSDISKVTNQLKLEKLFGLRTPIGTVGVDSGSFGVFYLNEVLKYNPNFLADIDSSCYTIIKDFTGLIDTMKIESNINSDLSVIMGIGNKSFYTEI